MDTNEFVQRTDELVKQTLELLTEVERGGLIEEDTTETQGKVKIKTAINKLNVNVEALEHVAGKHFKVDGKEEQLNE